MKIKPEDRPKLFGLLAAIGIMFCYLIFVVVPSLSGAQTTAAPISALPAASVIAPAFAAPKSDKQSSPMMEAGPVPDARQDPFLSPAPTVAAVAPSPAPPAAPPSAKPTAPQTVIASPASTQTAAQVAPKTRRLSLTLLGVASGEEQVAVFQAGENTLEKKKGDTLPGGFRLTAIDGDGITLKDIKSKAVHRLEVGHATTEIGSANEPHTD